MTSLRDKLAGIKNKNTIPVSQTTTESATESATPTNLNSLLGNKAKTPNVKSKPESPVNATNIDIIDAISNSPTPTPTPVAPVMDLNAPVAQAEETTQDVTSWPDQDNQSLAKPELATELSENLKRVENSIGTEDVRDAMYNITIFLQNNKSMVDTLLPEDIQLCIRALRSSTSNLIAKREASSTKKTKRSEEKEKIASMLADIGIGKG